MWLEKKRFARQAMSLFVCVLFIPQTVSIWDCGKRDIYFEHLIYYGHGAKEGQWPWHVAIYYEKHHNFDYNCGGSIIDSNTILTSAHCIYTQRGLHSASHIRVYVGRIMLNETNNHTQEHAVSKVIPHPNFRPSNVSYDIALIKLSRRIDFTAYVQPICLWGMDAGLELIVGANGTIVGFGETENSTLSNHLRAALVKVAEFWTCLDGNRNVLTDGMFCAKGNGDVNACRGDSGGGIVYEIAGKWFVRGIVSFIPLDSSASCDVSKFTVFTDVSKYREWIAKFVDPKTMVTQEEYLVENSPNVKLLNFDTCGASTFSTNSSSDNFPWIGLVENYVSENIDCQAILINEWYAIGPAHCFENTDGVQTILLGGREFNSDCKEGGPSFCAERRPIKTITTHEKYKRKSLEHDLSLIELGEPVNITKPNVVPICLPVKIEHRNHRPDSMILASFTKSYITLADFVAHYKAQYVNDTICQNAYASGGILLNMDHSKFCTDSGEGDIITGAPIHSLESLGRRNKYFLRGISLFGFSSQSRVHMPRVMINIDYYLSWILYNMNNRNEKGRSARSEKWKLLPIDTCGKIIDERFGYPWNGFLKSFNSDSASSFSLKAITLISEWYALSNAGGTSFEKNEIILGDIDVLYGIPCESRRREKICSPPIQKIQIKQIIHHPEYSEQSYDYSIELIQFVAPADLTKPNVQPICLPFSPLEPNNKPIALHFISGKQSRSYGVKYMELIDHNECRLQGAFMGHFDHITNDELCLSTRKRRCPELLFGQFLQALQTYNNEHRYFIRAAYSYKNCGAGLIITKDIGVHVKWILNNIINNTLELNQKIAIREEIINNALKESPSNITEELLALGLLNFETCGTNYNIRETTKAAFERFPWIGFLHEEQNGAPLCRVILISHWYAIAPAHCFRDPNPSSYFIRFGPSDAYLKSYQNKTKNEAASIQTVQIESFIRHENYKNLHYKNVAIIIFKTPVTIGELSVVPICLPIMDIFLNFDIHQTIVATDPATDRAEFTSSYFLKDSIKMYTCANADEFLTDPSFYAMAIEIDQPTSITSGSPLQAIQKLGGVEQYFLIGFLINFYEENDVLPAMKNYIDVAYHCEWILQKMKDNLPLDIRNKLIYENKPNVT